MAQTPLTVDGRLPARQRIGVLASAGADVADPVAPILMEFESPTAALLARPVPLRSRFTIWVITSMVAVGMVIAWTVPLDRIVTSNGKVVATSQNIVVQPLETSIVRAIEVKEGQLVHAGDVLARLDPTFATADAGSLETQVASLQAEADRLTAETENRPYISNGTAPGDLQSMIFAQRHAERSFKLENYRQKIDGLQVKVTQANSDISAYTERLALARTVENKRRELERLGVGSQLNALQALDTRIDIESRLTTAKSARDSGQRDLDALMAERDGYLHQVQFESSQQLTEQGRKLAEAKENLNKARLRRNLVLLKADRDSIVLNIAPVNVGSVMQSGDQFITLVPSDAPLEVETLVDGRDVGFVRVGDPVTIKFETFPYYAYGTARGVVRTVSPDSFRRPMDEREKVARPRTEEAMGTMFYRAKISLDELNLHDLPAGARLMPGMPATGDIKVGKRTFIQYIMSRVIPATTEGMREP